MQKPAQPSGYGQVRDAAGGGGNRAPTTGTAARPGGMFSPSQWGQTGQSNYGEAGNRFDPQFYVVQSPMQTQPQQPTWNPTFNITIPSAPQQSQPSALAGLPPATPRPQGTVPTAPAFTATPTPRPSGTTPTPSPAPTVMDLPQSAFVQAPGGVQQTDNGKAMTGTVTPPSGNGPDYVRQAVDYARALRSNAGIKF